MQASRRAPGYDLFKLIVAIILLILLFFLIRRPTPQAFTPAPTVLFPTPTIASNSLSTVRATPTPSPVPSTRTQLRATQSPGSADQRTDTPMPPSTATESTTDSASSTPPPPTVTPSPISTATDTVVLAPTPVPPSTSSPGIVPTAAPNARTPVASVCEAATSHSRLQAGTKATILRRLNFRSSAGIRDNWLLTNIPGTQVEIVSGPECVPYWTGAYVWWQIKLPDGRIGWSAEGSLQGTFYFMKPVE